jgi:hypothetical protein
VKLFLVTLNRTRYDAVVFAAAILGFLSMATAIALTIDAPDLLRLQRRHAETFGQILQLHPNSQGLVQIGYSVGGVSYKRDVPVFAVDSVLAPQIQDSKPMARIYRSPPACG